ncbi:hypothetical protein ACF0H5_008698 [Mactra antiquata]
MATAGNIGNSTPRSALRTINAGQESIKSHIPTQIRKPGLQAPIQKLINTQGLHSKQSFNKENASKELQIFVDPKPQQKVAVSKKEEVKVPDPLPEKEFMNVFNPEDDLKPISDRALIGIVGRIKKWRPPCMFGACMPDPDIKISDDDDDVHDDNDVIFDEPKMSSGIFPPLETDLELDISPDIGDIQLEVIDVPEVSDFPFIDDDLVNISTEIECLTLE